MNKKKNRCIKIRLESFNYQLLNSSCSKIIGLIKNLDIDSIGLVPLPTKKRIYCVLRSPHVDKDSREHFEVRIHKRLLEIYHNRSDDTIFKVLAESDLPSGIFYRLAFS